MPVMLRQEREGDRGGSGGWGLVCSVACQSARSLSHTHILRERFLTSLSLAQVMLHKLKSRASGGNSLKPAAASAIQALIPLK